MTAVACKALFLLKADGYAWVCAPRPSSAVDACMPAHDIRQRYTLFTLETPQMPVHHGI